MYHSSQIQPELFSKKRYVLLEIKEKPLCVTSAVCSAPKYFTCQSAFEFLTETRSCFCDTALRVVAPTCWGYSILWVICHSHASPTTVSSPFRCVVLLQVAFPSISWLCLCLALRVRWHETKKIQKGVNRVRFTISCRFPCPHFPGLL